MPEKWATTAEVAEAAGGVAASTVLRWAERGLLPKPKIQHRGRGHGTRALWRADAPERARWVAAQLDAGHTHAEILAMASESDGSR